MMRSEKRQKVFSIWLFSLILLIFNIYKIQAQDAGKLADHLVALENAMSDSARIEAYRDMSFDYSLTNPDSGIYYGQKALQLSTAINYRKGIADSHNSLGWCYSNKGDFRKAKSHLTESINIFRETGDSCFVAVAIANMGNLYYTQGLKTEALEHFLYSRKLNESCPDNGFKASGIYSIGTIYNSLKEYGKAISYFEEAYTINMSNADTGKAADCINGIGNALLGKKEFDKALRQFDRSLKLYLEFKNLYGAAFASESIGTVYYEKGNYEKALESFFLAKQYFEQLGNKPDICYELMTIGKTYHQKKDYLSAIKYLSEGLALAEANGFHSLRQQLNEAISQVYESAGDFRLAFGYYKAATHIRDSLARINQEEKLNELLVKHEAEVKDRTIELLNKDKQIIEAESDKQTQRMNLALAGLAMLSITSYVIYNRFRLKKRHAISLEEKNRVIQTEKERAEKGERFRQEFLANMSHEIRTPLNSILGMLELMELNPDKKNDHTYLDAIRSSSKNLHVIVNDILDLSKLESGKLQIHPVPLPINQMINHLRQMFGELARKKGLLFEVEADADFPEIIQADYPRLSQILVNLTGNAIKFTKEGYVRVRFRSATQDKIENNSVTNASNRILQFIISDSGPGIPETERELIFESFAQSQNNTSIGGTGLGLPISKQLARLMGGEITMKSEPGLGSEFTLFLPELKAGTQQQLNTAEPEQNEVPEYHVSRPLRVLLADDHEYNRLLVKDALQSRISDVIISEVENGREVINALKALENNEQWPDIILLDIRMPILNGFETINLIQQQLNPMIRKIPVIALTADVLHLNESTTLLKPFDEIIFKPFRIRELVEKVMLLSGINAIKVESIRKERLEFSRISHEIINLEYLNEFTNGDLSEIVKYAIIFTERIPALMKSLKESIESGEFASALKTLHSARPMIAGFEVKGSLDLINRLQLSLKTDNRESIANQLTELSDLCMAAVQELKTFVKSAPDGGSETIL